MSDILTFVKEELELQKSLLRRSQKILAHAPEGTLRYRPRKKGDAFYQARFSSGIVKEMNITENKAAIDDLIQKRISRETIPAAQKNIKIDVYKRQGFLYRIRVQHVVPLLVFNHQIVVVSNLDLYRRLCVDKVNGALHLASFKA